MLVSVPDGLLGLDFSILNKRNPRVNRNFVENDVAAHPPSAASSKSEWLSAFDGGKTERKPGNENQSSH